jgi:hypothetical protein
MLAYALVLGIALVVGLNTWISIRLLRSPYFERNQKIAQLVLIWIVPIVGAVVVAFVMTNESSSEPSLSDPLQTQETQGAVTWGDYSESHHSGDGGHHV